VAVTANIGFANGAGVPNLDVAWIHGSEAAKYNTDPDIQVHACDEHTYILRQNKAVHYEAPFMFLLFGADKAVLLDTGATADPRFFPLRRTVDEIVDGWLAEHPHPDDYGLLVLHTHGHSDHVAGDGQFTAGPTPSWSARPATRCGRISASIPSPNRPPRSTSAAACSTASARPGTTMRRSPSTTGIPGSCSPATPSTRAACTSSTGRPSPARYVLPEMIITPDG
jgi:hypothetical protein